ncbi:hypothetical protein AB4Z34_15530 [Ensifer sp. 2YAB10]
MPKKRLPSAEHADTLSLNALRSLVTGLVSEVRELSAEVTKLRPENAEFRQENAALRQENTRTKVEKQLLRDEIAILKSLPPRPPFRPSGMEKATVFKLDDPPAPAECWLTPDGKMLLAPLPAGIERKRSKRRTPG